jgi:succinate dehydrogenase / fumarate reductase flavoprotein subunit
MIDVLIIGSGGTGLSAALSAKESGSKVLVVSESYPTRSQTSMAQGAINAVIDDTFNDSVENHIKDTLKAAYGLAEESMVKKMCKGAKEAIFWLDSLGVTFSRTKDCKIARRRLGGVKHIRGCYSQDYTGLKIIQTLYDNCIKEEIEFLNEHYLLDLVVKDGRVVGALFYDIRDGKIVSISAKSVILATGGYSGIYHSHTTNNYWQVGDGIALAKKAGAKISNLEFVQFHPTGLRKTSTLISESARGAGGKLLDKDLKRFCDELLPRDQVSRAIWSEIQKGGVVYLDISHLGEEFINENLPQERKLALFYEGVDIAKEPVAIKPVAHYSMGGIDVDNYLKSSIDSLYCVGECSNSRVHGANRLGGNSLLEIIVFGREVGKDASFEAKSAKSSEIDANKVEKKSKEIQKILDNDATINFYERRDTLGEALYKYAGVVRDESGLKKLIATIEQNANEIDKMGVVDRSSRYNTNLIEFLKFKNSLVIAKEIATAALNRKESVGAHFRSDL